MSQYINLSSLYSNGLNVSWTSNTTLTIAPGQCRDSTNSFDITLLQNTVLNAANTGLNGLDQGVLANNTMYYPFVIYDSSLQHIVGTILSASATNPYMPFYGYFRRVGVAKTDGSAHFLKFYRKSINSNFVFHQWDSPITVLSGGTATTFTAQSLATAAPAQAERVYLKTIYTPALAANTASIRPTGSAAAAGSCPIDLKESVNAVAVNRNMIPILPQPSSGNLSIDYVVTASDTLTLQVAAFEDKL